MADRYVRLPVFERGSDTPPPCEHPNMPPVAFDEAECANNDAFWIRQHYPRGYGQCPDCKAHVVRYASFTHYIAGDW